MEWSTAVVIIVIVAMGTYLYCNQSSYEVVNVQSSVDGQTYIVRNLPDKQAAADMLARIREKLNRTVAHLREKFGHLPCVTRLAQRYHGESERITESTPDSKYTSYSVNKGEKIYFCLRQRGKREELVQENIMMFVSLHELSHVMTESVGHTPEFWHTFAFVLREAQAIHVYEYRDFSSQPAEYCGVHITDVPRIPIDEIESAEREDAERGKGVM